MTSASTSRYKDSEPLWMSSTLFGGTDASGMTSDEQHDIEMVDNAQGLSWSTAAGDATRVQVTSNPIFSKSAPDRVAVGRPMTPNLLHADGACDEIGEA